MTRRCLAGTKQHEGRPSDPARASGQDQMEQWIEKLRQCGPPIGGGGASKNPSQQGWMLMVSRTFFPRPLLHDLDRLSRLLLNAHLVSTGGALVVEALLGAAARRDPRPLRPRLHLAQGHLQAQPL